MDLDIRRYTANFHITHNCNMRCTYCYAGEHIQQSMADDVIENSIDFVVKQVELRQANQLVLSFLGGEPLMERKKMFYIQDEFKQRLGQEVKVITQFSTNGLLLTDRVMQELTQRSIMISLSLDGTPETMQQQRPTVSPKDYSQQIERAIQSVLKYNPFTNAFCVITPQSAPNAFENIIWIYEQGMRFINVTLDYSALWTRQGFELLAREYKKLTK